MTVRLSKSKKILIGMGIAVVMLGILEISLRVYCTISGQDLTVAPLPMTYSEEVLIDLGDEFELIPQRHGDRSAPEREVVFAKEPTRPRVVVIGESFVYSTGLSGPEAWPARLEAQFDGEVEVLNFGRVGTHASMLTPVVEASLDIGAEVIILAIGNNEHTMTTYYTGWAGRHPDLVYSLSEALGSIHIYGLLYNLVLGEQRVEEVHEEADAGSREFEDPIDREIYSIRQRPPQLHVVPDMLAQREVTAALMAEKRLKERVFKGILRGMVQDIQAAGVMVVLATLPVKLADGPHLSGIHSGGVDPSEETGLRRVMNKLEVATDFSRVQAAVEEQGLNEEDLLRNAHYQFAKGHSFLVQGKKEEALEALRRAVEWDMVPDNTPGLNEIIREVAREFDCPLVDLNERAEVYLERNSTFFMDSIHVTAEGADIVADWVAEVLRVETGLMDVVRGSTGR